MTETKEQTKEELKLQRRRARLEASLKRLRCHDDVAEKLEQLYGLDIAEKLVQKSLSRPSDVAGACGVKFMPSRKLVEYLAENNLSDEVVAKATRTTIKEVAVSRAAVGADAPAKEEPAAKELEDKVKEKEKHFNQRVNNKDKNNKTSLTWDNLAQNVPENQKIKSYEQLREAAYKDYCKSEFKTSRVYLDCNGHPTTGIGHLIFRKDEVNDTKKMAAYKEAYQQLDLYRNGKKMTAAQKAAEFDQLAKAVRNGTVKAEKDVPRYVLSPATGKLSEKGIQDAFNKDFKYIYDRTKATPRVRNVGTKKNKKYVYNGAVTHLDDLPIDMAVSVLHTTMAGQVSQLDARTPETLMKSVENCRGMKKNRRGKKYYRPGVARPEQDSVKVARQALNDTISNVATRQRAEIQMAQKQQEQPHDIDLKEIMQQQRSEAGKAVQVQTVKPKAKEPENKTIKVAEKRTEQTQETPAAATENQPQTIQTVSAETLYKLFGKGGRS